MKSRLTGGLVVIFLIGAGAMTAECRKKAPEDFPDYNRLEYAKERPPADKQSADPVPGSINMRVGDKRQDARDTSLEVLPIPLRPAVAADTTEPPLDFMETPTAVAPVVSTPTATTAPAQ